MPTNTSMRIVIALLVFLLTPVTGRAEYTRVELKIFGMDCAICAHGVRVAVQKVDGVESVELSLERAQADIRLKPGNRVPLDRFRQIVKGNGFEPREASVTAIGNVREIGGKLSFEVSGVSTPLVVATDKTPPAILKTLTAALDAKASTPFEVTGSVTIGKGVTETIAIATAQQR